MRKVITGEQMAQLYNRDPFALPAWRAPIYQTPAGFILLVQLARLLGWLVRVIARHPLAAAAGQYAAELEKFAARDCTTTGTNEPAGQAA